MRERELPAWLWIWLPPVLMAVILATRVVDPARHEEWFNTKEGPIEWLTILVLVPAIVVGVRAFRMRRYLPAKWLGGYVLIITLGAFYFAGEEVSWGQHVWNWEAPEALKSVNRQDETNLHNITGWFNEKPRAILETFVLFGGILVPLWLRKRWGIQGEPSDWRTWFWPTAVCVPTAIITILVRVPDRLERVLGDFMDKAHLRLSEPQEYYFGFFLLIFLASINARLRRLAKS